MSVTNPDKVVTKQDLADFYTDLLPYLGGNLPVVGTINRSDILSTTEKVVGCSADGKPIYQKTFLGTFPSTLTYTAVTFEIGSITNLDSLIKSTITARWYDGDSAGSNGWLDLLGVNSSGVANANTSMTGNTIYNLADIFSDNTGKISCRLQSNSTGQAILKSQPYIATIQYTKTTDAANSFNYASENDYSTSEKIIGTWYDGSTLYQRTFTGTTSNSADSITVATISGAKIKKMFGIISTSSTNIDSSTDQVLIPVSASKAAGFSDDVNIFPYNVNGTITLFFGSGLNTYRNRGYALTVQYTKS